MGRRDLRNRQPCRPARPPGRSLKQFRRQGEPTAGSSKSTCYWLDPLLAPRSGRGIDPAGRRRFVGSALGGTDHGFAQQAAMDRVAVLEDLDDGAARLAGVLDLEHDLMEVRVERFA